MDDSGYAVRLPPRPALPQLPALPERTCPLMRDVRLGRSLPAPTPNCDAWFAAVGVVALKSSWTSLPLNE